MEDNNDQLPTEGVDFSNFPKTHQAKTPTPPAPVAPFYKKIRMAPKTIYLVLLIIIMVATSVFLLVRYSGLFFQKTAPIPPGYHYLSTPGQPAKIELNK